MKKNNIIYFIMKTGICLMPIIIGIILYDNLPERIAVHFDSNGTPDNYVSKNFFLYGIPILMACGQLILSIIIWNQKKKIKNTPKLINILEWIIPMITIYIYYLMISYAFNNDFNITKASTVLVGIVLCLLGNYLPKMSYEENRNYINPKPSDEKSFRLMTRTFGYCLFILGIVIILISLFTF